MSLKVKVAIFTVLFLFVPLLGISPAIAQSNGFVPVFRDDFNSFDQNIWDYNFSMVHSQWIGPEGGSVCTSDGILYMRPYYVRGACLLESKGKVLTSLPAKVKFRIKFEGGERSWRGTQIALISQPDLEWTANYPYIHWYTGETASWGGGGHILLKDADGNISDSAKGVYTVPCATWLEGEMRLYDDRIEGDFNNNHYTTYGNVRSLLDYSGGLYLFVMTNDDYSRNGFDLDWIEVDQKPTIDQLIELKHQFYQTGSIDNAGIVKSLDAKLNAAKAALERNQNETAKKILKAFVSEVSAQSGKHIKEEDASKLVMYAEAIIESI